MGFGCLKMTLLSSHLVHGHGPRRSIPLNHWSGAFAPLVSSCLDVSIYPLLFVAELKTFSLFGTM
jgi:hypothetical protein